MAQAVTNLLKNRVSEDEVRAIPEPEFTKTHRPYSHARVLDAVGKAVTDLDLKVVDRQYSMRPGGRSMFGSWEVENGEKDFNFLIGIRNSLDKTWSYGLCAGQKMFICENMLYSSQFVMFRKHTGSLSEEEIYYIACQTVEAVVDREFKAFKEWHDSLANTGLTSQQATLLMAAAIRKGVIYSQKTPEFLDLYFRSGKYDVDLKGWYGATTELMKNYNLVDMQSRTSRLVDFLNFEVPILLSETAEKESRLDFVCIENMAKEKAKEAKEVEKIKTKEWRDGVMKDTEEMRKEELKKKKGGKGKVKAKKSSSRRTAETSPSGEKKGESEKKKVKKPTKRERTKANIREAVKSKPRKKKKMKKLNPELDSKAEELVDAVNEIAPNSMKKCSRCGAINMKNVVKCHSCGEDV